MTHSVDQIEALKELINIGMGQAAKSLNDMLDMHISLHVPDLMFGTFDELQDSLKRSYAIDYSSISLDFHGEMSGRASLVIPRTNASRLISAVLDGEYAEEDLDVVRAGTLTEIGNIMINSVMGTFSNQLNSPIRYNPPEYNENRAGSAEFIQQSNGEVAVVILQTRFEISSFETRGEIILVFRLPAIESLTQMAQNMYEV
ncbi:MAG: chemotaxis protein CheC [bacterium]|nr:chemotaxis protein CheC [bacterium]